MSGEEDLYLNQSEADALFFSDALLGNADGLDFESFGDASGLDDGTYNGITGPGLTSFEARDVFKLNVDSFVDEIEAKCEITNPTELAANNVHSFSNGTSSHDSTFIFNKPTLDLEGMGMAYGISGLYLQQQGNMSPSSEKMNGLTLGQMPGYSTYETKQFMSSPPPVAAVAAPPVANGMSRFGSQEILMAAAENGALKESTTSPVLSPSSSDGKGVIRQDSGTDFDDQVDGDGDGLQPLPQMTRSSMQRSFSSHALGQLRHIGPATHSVSEMRQSQQVERGVAGGGGGLTSPGARLHQPSLAEFQNVGMRPMSVGMRRVYSAGDIQTLNGMQGGLGGGASPSFDDGNYRVGKYSMEERKIRIHRYQQKRTQRNFNKKIKYACRKTLADSRPRVRGRFAKNMDDDIPVAVLGRKREDDDDDEGDAHVGEGANGFHFDNSSGEYSDMLTSIKVEHQRVNSM